MFATRRRRLGFTIVEMLIVVGIIGVLAALLLPAVGSATRTARKAEENNRLRQVGIAWNLYSNANEDGALPGFLPEDVQLRWKATYRLADKQAWTGGPVVGQVPATEAQTWPWRLAPFLDYSQDVLIGYQDLADMSPVKMSEYRNDPQYLDPNGEKRPVNIAWQPAFGYNAFYVGGWWEMVEIEGELVPRTRFYDVEPLDPSGNPIPNPGGNGNYRTNVVVRTPSVIRNTSELILFCSAAERPVGQIRSTDDFEIGSHYVAAPIMDNQPLWGRPLTQGSPTVIEVFAELFDDGTGVPIGRYTGQVSVLRADGSTDAETPGVLEDQRLWINQADHRAYTHQSPP